VTAAPARCPAPGAARRPAALLHALGAAALALALAGCGLTRPLGPEHEGPPTDAVRAQRWTAPQPPQAADAAAAEGDRERAGALARWWRQFDDPLLAELVDSAQASSGNVAQAAARITRARYALVDAAAGTLPSLDGSASLERSAMAMNGPVMQQSQARAQVRSSWEIDLFGGLARQREAAGARLDARRAEWHDARVSVAAETAAAYAELRRCEQRVRVVEIDARSRQETARVMAVASRAGLQPPAAVAQASAAAAETTDRVLRERAQCDLNVKALVALTDADETELRAKLAANAARLPVPASFRVDAVPARVLSQRPDLAALEREIAAASASIGVAEAAQYPRLTLAGSIGPLRLSTNGMEISTTTWSIGPTLTVPMVSHGRTQANLEAARAEYEAARSAYRASARIAVREVEEGLVRLAAANERETHAVTAVEQHRRALAATEARHRSGLASLLELEDARRSTLQAESALIDLRHERLSAWVALYRAVGGGWLDETKQEQEPQR